MSVESGVRADLKAMPEDVRKSGLAESALALARAMDDFETSATEVASCARALAVTLDRLRELAPPEQAKDGVDDIAAQRQKRLGRLAATQD